MLSLTLIKVTSRGGGIPT